MTMRTLKNIIILFLLLTSCIAFSQAKYVAKPSNEALKEEVFIITELNKTNVTVSDSIVVKYKLFVSHSTGISSWNEESELIYKDFNAHKTDIGQMSITYEKHNGQEYRTVLLKEVILKPTKTGKFQLPKYILNVTAEVPSNPPKQAYNRPKLEKKAITITTNSINLTVK